MIRYTTRTANRLWSLPRPRPATVIALLALTTATGGTSIAAGVLDGSALKNGSVSRSKIAPKAIDATRLAANAVTSTSLARGAVSPSKLAKASVTAAALAPGSVTGPALAAGAVAGSNLAGTAVSWKALGGQIVTASPIALPVGTTEVVPVTATASCPAGTVAISGGELISDPVFAYVTQSLPAALPGGAATGWTATGATVGSLPATMTVYAICINAGS